MVSTEQLRALKRKIGSNKCKKYLRSAVRVRLPFNITIYCYEITKMRDFSAINLRPITLPNALPSNMFSSEKQFLLFNFQFKCELHRLEFPYKAPHFRSRNSKVCSYAQCFNIGKTKSDKKNKQIYCKNLVPVDTPV